MLRSSRTNAPDDFEPLLPSGRLALSTLSDIPTGVSRPAYGREVLSPGILHVGVGNFHRAHQAMYLHRLFEQGRDHDWVIIGGGVKPSDAVMHAKLGAQDWLTTVVELDPAGLSASVCGSMVDFAPVEPEALIAVMARPDIRIVSLTVTEGGYFVDAGTGGFDASHSEILADLADRRRPRTVFGAIIAALARRRAANVPPFTVMSCDNLPENGHVARQAVLGLARSMQPGMEDWIAANVAFPNGMVDCITPATGPREIALVRNRFGIDDAAPVVCEPFRQWVLEDNFPQGRPALEEVGVRFVADVGLYELMKLRILNGGHAAIAYISGLLGIRYVHEAMRHPLVSGFLDRLEHEEIIPTVPAPRREDLEAYYRKIVERFSNPEIEDTVARLCLDGSNRQPKFILPTVADRLRKGRPVQGLALEVALWCRYCAGTDENGRTIAVDDPMAEELSDGHAKPRRIPPPGCGCPACSDLSARTHASPDLSPARSLRSGGTASHRRSAATCRERPSPEMVRGGGAKMILCCGEALIDMLPHRVAQEETAYLPTPGGAAFNTAIALGRLGTPVSFFSGLSTDLFGRSLEAALADANVETRMCIRSPRPTTLAFVQLEAGHARYAFYDENTAGRMISHDDLPAIPDDVGAMLFGGISLASEPCGSAYETLMEREHPRRVMMFDPNIRADFIADRQRHLDRMRRMLSMADIFKLSEEDLLWFGGGWETEEIARAWLERGPKLIVVTSGSGDAVAYTKAARIRSQPCRVEVADTIGAGDTFNAGILTALHEQGVLTKSGLSGLSEAQIRKAMGFANKAAAVTVSRAGANPPWRSELQ